MIIVYKLNDTITHHGVEGQKWGVKNGPPYPLQRYGSGQIKKNDFKRSVGGSMKNSESDSSDIVNKLKSAEGFYGGKGASDKQISNAEKKLGTKFAREYKDCLREYGSVSVDGHELTGFSTDKRLDVEAVTKKNRQQTKSTSNLYVIEEANIDGIVVWQDNKGKVYVTAPESEPVQIYDSLSDYLELGKLNK